MTTGATGQLGLALPVQGELTGSWGNTVNNAITEYTNIAIAGTLTLTGDGAVTLTNTTGTDLATNITAGSTLAGAGTATAQFAAVRVSGTTTTKVITFGSAGSAPYSKTYLVDNASSYAVTFKAYGQTGVSIAAAEKCTVYYNGTDIVKVASSVADGVTSVAGTGTVNGITLTGTVTSTGSLTLGGTLANVDLTSQVTGVLPVANGGNGTATPALTQGSNVTITGSWPNYTIAAASPGTGTVTSVTASLPLASSGGNTPDISISSSTGSGAVVLATSPTLTTPLLGTPTSGNLSNCTADGTNKVGYLNMPQNAQTGNYTLVLADAGKHIYHAAGAGAATYTIPANGSVAYDIGTAVSFINLSTTAISIAITTDTMYLSTAGTTGTRTLAQYGTATAVKVTATAWIITGSGLT